MYNYFSKEAQPGTSPLLITSTQTLVKSRTWPGMGLDTGATEVYMVLMEFDNEYERLKSDRRATRELELYVSNKHDRLLQRTLRPGSYKKRFSWVIIDGFVAEMTRDQADVLRSAVEVRVVEKDQELKSP